MPMPGRSRSLICWYLYLSEVALYVVGVELGPEIGGPAGVGVVVVAADGGEGFSGGGVYEGPVVGGDFYEAEGALGCIGSGASGQEKG